MSINITKNTESASVDMNKIVQKQPRDEKGKFVKKPSVDEVLSIYQIKKEGNENKRFVPVFLNFIKDAAPYMANCIEDNGILKMMIQDGQIGSVLYLSQNVDSYYLFFRRRDSFGFRMNCGNMEDILKTEDINKLLNNFNPMDWSTIQKA